MPCKSSHRRPFRTRGLKSYQTTSPLAAYKLPPVAVLWRPRRGCLKEGGFGDVLVVSETAYLLRQRRHSILPAAGNGPQAMWGRSLLALLGPRDLGHRRRVPIQFLGHRGIRQRCRIDYLYFEESRKQCHINGQRRSIAECRDAHNKQSSMSIIITTVLYWVPSTYAPLTESGT